MHSLFSTLVIIDIVSLYKVLILCLLVRRAILFCCSCYWCFFSVHSSNSIGVFDLIWIDTGNVKIENQRANQFDSSSWCMNSVTWSLRRDKRRKQTDPTRTQQGKTSNQIRATPNLKIALSGKYSMLSFYTCFILLQTNRTECDFQFSVSNLPFIIRMLQRYLCKIQSQNMLHI